VRQDILLNRVREREVDGRLQISESELDNFIAAQTGVAADTEEINLAQILLRVPENATANRIEETRQRADDLVSQLKGGADFARLAASFSNASEALQGGALGWRNTDRLPALFIDAVKNVKVGDIAPVVRSPNGFHILKVSGAAAPSKASSPAGRCSRLAHGTFCCAFPMWHPSPRSSAGSRNSRRASKTARSSSARLRACIRSTPVAPAAVTSAGSTPRHGS